MNNQNKNTNAYSLKVLPRLTNFWLSLVHLVLIDLVLSAIRMASVVVALVFSYDLLLRCLNLPLWPQIISVRPLFSIENPLWALLISGLEIALIIAGYWLKNCSGRWLERDRLRAEQAGLYLLPWLQDEHNQTKATLLQTGHKLAQAESKLAGKMAQLDLIKKHLAESNTTLLAEQHSRQQVEARLKAVLLNAQRLESELYSAKANFKTVKEELEATREELSECESAANHTLPSLENPKTLARIFSGEIIPLGWEVKREWDPHSQEWYHYLEDEPELCYMLGSQLNYNALNAAPSGSGKTENYVEPLVSYCQRARVAALVFDPKGDGLERGKFQGHFSTLPAERAYSLRLCLLDQRLEFTAAANQLAEDLLFSASAQRTNPYFVETGRKALATMVKTYHLLHGHWPNDLFELAEYLSQRQSLPWQLTKLWQIAEDSEHYSPLWRNRALETAYGLEELQKLKQSQGDLLGALSNALDGLNYGEYRQLITLNPEYGYSVRELLDRRLLVRVGLNIGQERDKRLGRILITQYKNAVLQPDIDKSYLKLLIIDEAHQLVCDAIRDGVPQSRGNKAGFILIFQSLEQIRDERAISVIFGSCRNKIAFSGLEGSDARRFSEFLGTESVEVISQSKSHAVNYDWSGESDLRTGYNTNYERQPRWAASDLTHLPGYHGLYTLYDPESGECYTKLVKFFESGDWAYLNRVPLLDPPATAKKLDRQRLATTLITVPTTSLAEAPQAKSSLEPNPILNPELKRKKSVRPLAKDSDGSDDKTKPPPIMPGEMV